MLTVLELTAQGGVADQVDEIVGVELLGALGPRELERLHKRPALSLGHLLAGDSVVDADGVMHGSLSLGGVTFNATDGEGAESAIDKIFDAHGFAPISAIAIRRATETKMKTVA